MKKTALLLGASGLTGGLLLELLLSDSDFDRIKLFSRKNSGIAHPKIEEHIVDLLHLENHAAYFTGDVVFCCIGTTKAKTPDQTEYKAIDFGIPVTAAQLAKQNNIPTFIVISALGANVKSPVFYNRIKGEMERSVIGLGIPRTYILEPSLIASDRNEARVGEMMGIYLMKIINPILIGKLKKYRSIAPENIAKTMWYLSKNDYPKTIIPSDMIFKLSQSG
ncbi:nucleoside-diphosphate-sugar epimerase [Flavobacterium limnosediminis JC2902]|uniref:Nucleoside-diphosphate-sugar epimerase n=1 Tax=Flavobacterium limnosediminis JC2902 TaxID=1341181 RepID=V6SZM0_9FLAO|nr:NAD(P)H-binding protein [Flavobacterium limnosediminis]ESU29865.1 nucleoside-diphosphate-sugar epimerase [Flavobacterium limnosediminis JC2902]